MQTVSLDITALDQCVNQIDKSSKHLAMLGTVTKAAVELSTTEQIELAIEQLRSVLASYQTLTNRDTDHVRLVSEQRRLMDLSF